MSHFCKKLLTIFILVLCALMPVAAFANEGEGGGDHWIDIYIYHDYYVPFLAGMDNCYGAYRTLATRGYHDQETLAVKRTVSSSGILGTIAGMKPTTDYVGMNTDGRTIYRDDMLTFATIGSGAYHAKPYDFTIIEENYPYRYHHIHNYYWETPVSFVGKMSDMTPITGSSASDLNNGQPWVIATDADKISQYMPGFQMSWLMPEYEKFNAGNYIYSSFSVCDPSNVWTQMRDAKGNLINGWTGKTKFVVLRTYCDKQSYAKNNKFNRYFYKGRYFSGYDTVIHYKYILSMNPSTCIDNKYVDMSNGDHNNGRYRIEKVNATNQDLIGWWSLYNNSVLATISDINKTGATDKKSSYDNSLIPAFDTATNTRNILPTAMLNALSWKGLKISYIKRDLDMFHYDTSISLSERAKNGVFRWYNIPTQREVHKTWEDMADKIVANVTAGKSFILPWKSGGYPLDMLQSTTQGFWVPPKADMLENKNMSVYSSNPDFIGKAPFSRAQTALYYKGLKKTSTLAGINDGYDAMDRFLGASGIGRNTNYLSAFVNKSMNAPIRSGWNDPWLPYKVADGSIWNYWYKGNKNFYKAIVPLQAIDLGMVLYPVDGVTAWNLGVSRKWNSKLLYNAALDINDNANFSAAKQAEFKARANMAEYGASDTARYMQEMKNMPTTDFGNVTLNGKNYVTYSTLMSVRFFPVDTSNNSLGVMENYFVGLGKTIPVPSYLPHQTLWKYFPLPSKGTAGVTLTPPQWENL